ncbi:MAG: carbohydrate ABC transporter permease [Spirochaetota bacterium]
MRDRMVGHMNVVGEKRGAAYYAGHIFKWCVLVFFLFFTLMPLVWLLVSSFKTNIELQQAPFAFPAVWQVNNYRNALEVAELPRLFVNSILVSAISTALSMLITSMAAFVFARETFRFQQWLLNIIIAGVLVPIIALMAPYFRLTNALGLYDTLVALVLTYTAINIPISTFLMYGFMKAIPTELEEAAVIDGASFYRRFWMVIFPLSRVGLVTAGTFVFLFSWNEFIYAMLLTSSVGARTLQLGIRFFNSQFFTDYTSMFAAITLAIVPSILAYVFMHERIIQGLTSGALKG